MSRLPFAPESDEIHVDVEAAELRFATRPGTTFSAGDLRQVLRKAGYDIGAVSVDGTPVPLPD